MLNNDLIVRDMLRKKFGYIQQESEQRRTLPTYEEAKEAGNVKDMLRAKVFANEARYNDTEKAIEGLSISKVVINRKALEQRLEEIQEEYQRELDIAEHDLVTIYTEKIKQAKDGLERSFLRKNCMELINEKKERIEKSYGQRIRDYRTDVQVHKAREAQFEKENQEMIKQVEDEERKKSVREYLNTK